MLLKLGIVAAVGYGIYRYATTNSDMAMAYSGGESGTGRVDSDDYATPYSASDDLTGIPGIGSSNIAAQGSRTPHLDQPQ